MPRRLRATGSLCEHVNSINRQEQRANRRLRRADGREKNGIRMLAWREVRSDHEIWQATAYVLSIRKTKP